MTLTLPSLAGLILLLLAFIDPTIRYADDFHLTLTTLLYLGFVTSLIALGLSVSKRTGSSRHHQNLPRPEHRLVHLCHPHALPRLDVRPPLVNRASPNPLILLIPFKTPLPFSLPKIPFIPLFRQNFPCLPRLPL